MSVCQINHSLSSQLTLALEKAGLEPQDANRVVENPDIARAMVEAIRGVVKLDTTSFTVTVRHAKLESLIRAGKYDWVNSDITEEHFPVTVDGESEVTVELIHFNKEMSTEAVEQELDKRGLRPALIEELLALGAEHPELQRRFPIIALGSSWQDPHGDRYVPYLCEGADRRHLRLRWLGSDWAERCRFAAVRK